MTQSEEKLDFLITLNDFVLIGTVVMQQIHHLNWKSTL